MNKHSSMISKVKSRPVASLIGGPAVKYARLQGGRIVEHPVPFSSITKEDLDSGRVKPVKTHEHPTYCTKTQNCECVLKVVCGEPAWVYEVKQKPLSDFIRDAYIPEINQYKDLEELNSKTLTEDEIRTILSKLEEVAGKFLDDHAKSRGYDNINSLVSYQNDPNETFRSEAASGVRARSQVWVILSHLQEQVSGGVNSFPRDVEQVIQLFPNLTWE